MTPSVEMSAQTWIWQGFPITYQAQGNNGPAIVLVHGFGASWQHWRQNIPVLGTRCRCYALDLIGFGGSAKPAPGREIDYTFTTWAQQIADFCRQVVGGPAFLVGNSIGCIAIMQSAIDHPDIALGVALINCSLRLLHQRNRQELPWYRQMGVNVLQQVLRVPGVGQLFFRQLATPKTIRRVLSQAYYQQEAVTDELVDIILNPAADAGAVDVFLAFIGYDQGPLPAEQLSQLPCRAIILWGVEDPWEPIALGEALGEYPVVDQFIPLAEAGHCPQDEVPGVVNSILLQWVEPAPSDQQSVTAI